MKTTFHPFYDHPETFQYKTNQIGNTYELPLDIKRSSFTSVSEYVEVNTKNNIF
jgi:hypothetical protein